MKVALGSMGNAPEALHRWF